MILDYTTTETLWPQYPDGSIIQIEFTYYGAHRSPNREEPDEYEDVSIETIKDADGDVETTQEQLDSITQACFSHASEHAMARAEYEEER